MISCTNGSLLNNSNQRERASFVSMTWNQRFYSRWFFIGNVAFSWRQQDWPGLSSSTVCTKQPIFIYIFCRNAASSFSSFLSFHHRRCLSWVTPFSLASTLLCNFSFSDERRTDSITQESLVFTSSFKPNMWQNL